MHFIKHLIFQLFIASLICVTAKATEFKVSLLDESDGFSSSIIFSIVQDQQGYIWFGTGYDGLLRYDGENVVNYQHHSDDINSLAHNNAGNLALDSKNKLWIGSWGGSASILDLQTAKFTQYQYNQTKPDTLSDNRIQSIFEDQQGFIWLGSFQNGLNKFDAQQQVFTRFPFAQLTKNSSSHARIWDIAQTEQHGLWLGTGYGLNHYNIKTNTFSHFIADLGKQHQAHNRIRNVLPLPGDRLLLGTDDGVLTFDITHQTFTTLDIEGYNSIGAIYSMIKTSFGQYWVSSQSGVFGFSLDDLTLKKVKLGIDDHCSQTLFEDNKGTIWLTCEGLGIFKIVPSTLFNLHTSAVYSVMVTPDDNLLIATRHQGVKKWQPGQDQMTALAQDTIGIKQQTVLSMVQGSQGDIWHCSHDSVFKINSSGVQQQIRPPQTSRHSDLFKNFTVMNKDASGNLWIGTHNGLFIIKALTNDFDYLQSDNKDPHTLSDPSVVNISQDRHGRMWVATRNGLNLWHKDKQQFQQFHFTQPTDQNLEKNYIYAVYPGKNKNIWVGTLNGLFLLDPETGLYNRYGRDSGFINDTILSISQDSSGNLWLMTPLGLSKFDPKTSRAENFDKRDGLSGSRYSARPSAQTSDGTIYFPSGDGIHYFNPTTFEKGQSSAKTLLTNFEILGSQKRNKLIPVNMSQINLAHDENHIKFEFSTLDILNASFIDYSYKLEGLDEHWIENGTANTATYTNLSSGDYHFKVRAAVKGKLRYDNELAVKVHIATPWWQQRWMLVFYTGLVILTFSYAIKRSNKTVAIALESSRLAAASKVKNQFLANMSHEIRTPLTTIIGQSQAIIHGNVDSAELLQEVHIIHDSSLHLLALVNDILDLTKIEENKFELESTPQDLHLLLSDLHNMFFVQAKIKRLSFTINAALPYPFIINIDNLRLKQILINLCANAIKFTDKGMVTLNISSKNKRLTFNVIDTGIGMSQMQLTQVFNPFIQGDNSISRKFGGSGLGLSLSKQLASLMGGEISVRSELAHGSVFTLTLPVSAISEPAHLSNQAKPLHELVMPDKLFSGQILLAEDHPENNRLIKRILTKLGLAVHTAVNGFEVLDLYEKHLPKVILLDIHMPEMDGLQAYKRLRELGCRQPIIALTANAMTHEIDKYMTMGFDGHLKKPIEMQGFIATIAKYYQSTNAAGVLADDDALNKVDMSDLVAKFTASLIAEKQQFIDLEKSQDWQGIAQQAHRLAGAAQIFGFAQLADNACQLEASIKTDNMSQITASFQVLYHELSQILEVEPS